jgi:hypothetical protein
MQLPDSWNRCQKHELGKRQPLQQVVLGKLDITRRRLKLDACPSTCTKISSKWAKDLNSRPEMRLLEEEHFTISKAITFCIGPHLLRR